jgi:putative SOS response-associated peptidase YedK
MCYRFVRESKLVDIAKEFGISKIDSEFQPSYNVSPTQTIPAVIHDSTRRIALFRWGLIPPWAIRHIHR